MKEKVSEYTESKVQQDGTIAHTTQEVCMQRQPQLTKDILSPKRPGNPHKLAFSPELMIVVIIVLTVTDNSYITEQKTQNKNKKKPLKERPTRHSRIIQNQGVCTGT
jgi:hypothetical protein